MKIISVGVFGLLLSGCATQPWSVLDGNGATDVEEFREDVTVSSIDGQYFPGRPMYRRIKPGFHQVQVQTTRKGGQRADHFRDSPMMVEPCIRYVLAGEYKERTGNEDWNMIVRERAPITDCVVPEK